MATVPLYEMAANIPKTLRLSIHRLKQGRVAVDMDIHPLQRVSLAVERTATRVALAMLAAAFILVPGPTLLAWDQRLPGIALFPVLGRLGAVPGLELSMRRQKAVESQ